MEEWFVTPAKAGVQELSERLLSTSWIPAPAEYAALFRPTRNTHSGMSGRQILAVGI